MSINILREIAAGVAGSNVPEDNRIISEDAIGQMEIDKSEKFIADPEFKVLSNKDKILAYEESIGSRWKWTHNNKEYKHNMDAKLLGMTGPEYRKYLNKEVIRELDLSSDYSDKESWFRDYVHTLPDDVVKDVEPYFIGIGLLKNNKATARIEQHQKDDFSTKARALSIQNINTEKSLPWLSKTVVDLYLRGSLDQADTVEVVDGELTILQDGKRIPAYALPPQNRSLPTTFLAQRGLAPLAEKILKPKFEVERDKARQADRLVTMSHYNRAANGEIDDIEAFSFLVDGAELSDKPVDAIHNGIKSMVLAKVDRGEFSSVREAKQYLRHAYKSVFETVEGRLKHGTITT
jgi:hypothetical protein